MNISYLFKNYVKIYGINGLIQLSSIFVSYIFTIFITQSLGGTESGLYFLSLSIFVIIVQVITFGFQQSTLKIYSNYFINKSWNAIVFNTKKIEIFVSILGVLITIISIFFFYSFSYLIFEKPNLNSILLLVILSALPYSLVQVYGGILNGIRNHIFASLVTVLLIPLFTLIFLLIFNFFSSLNLILLGCFYFVACCIVLFVIKIFLHIKFRNYKAISITKIDFKSQLKFSFLLQSTCVLSILNSSVSTLLIGIFINDAINISYFNVANKVSLLCAIPIGAMSNIIAPKIASLYHKGEIKNLSNFIKSINLFFIILAIFITIILTTFSVQILRLFGEEFVNAQDILLILLFGQFVNLSAGCVGFLLSMTSHHKLLLKIIFFNTLFFVILNVFLVYLFGIIGAAITVSLNLCSLNIAYAIAIKKKLNISILPNKQTFNNYFKKLINSK